MRVYLGHSNHKLDNETLKSRYEEFFESRYESTEN